MAFDRAELDTRQTNYKAAVDAWVETIRAEEALASSAEHSETQIDLWEEACCRQETARKHAESAKKSYEAALREEFFGF